MDVSAPQPRSRSGTCVEQECKTQKPEIKGAMCPTAQIVREAKLLLVRGFGWGAFR